MQEPLDFYRKQKHKHEKALKSIKQQLLFSSLLRLVIFLSLCLFIYLFFNNVNVLVPSVLIGVVAFIFLINRHGDMLTERNKLRILIDMNETEIQIFKTRNYDQLPDGKEFLDTTHEFSNDIDLFGKGSFFQYMNRTAMPEGSRRLAEKLSGNCISGIIEKQKTTQELSEKAEWRQEFTAQAKLISSDVPASNILNWLREYKRFVPSYFKWLTVVFSILSLLVVVVFSMDFIGWMEFAILPVIGLMLTAPYLKKVNQFSSKISKVKNTFQQYHKLLGLIEDEKFESGILQQRQNAIRSEKEKASVIFKSFSKYIDALDQRNNFLFGFLGNAFLLWDLRQCYRLEQWIEIHKKHVKNWFETIEMTDADNSIGNFAFNHRSYVYPEIKENEAVVSAKKLAHPLLDPEKRIANDFTIADGEFLIITGANMAGKSTFLRTVSLQIVMSNIGLPVCAENCAYSPMKLISSMRTTDSLSDDESYFFSELKRLKFIIDQLKTDKYFIVLDEILKGTNSEDKARGSKKFVRKLVKSGSTGIIATHDLSLCEISNELPQIKNHYFDAEIINDELHFDYRFKDGICQNMNASFLLRKMEIVDD